MLAALYDPSANARQYFHADPRCRSVTRTLHHFHVLTPQTPLNRGYLPCDGC